jgi:tetratricopeptide (TPR) repeat protein
MPRFHELRWLPGLALLAVLMASPRAFHAQEPAQPPVPSPSAPTQAQPAAPAAAEPAVQNPVQTPATTQPVPAVPVIPPTPEELGDSFAGHQRYQAAIAAYSQVKVPTASLWNKLGIAYQMMFNLKDATRCYNASLKLDPRNATVLNNLATVYDSLKQYGMAERYYRKAIKIDPHSALVFRNFGSNQLTQHKYKKGWAAYQSALELDPQIFASHSGASVANPTSTQDRGAMHYYMAKGCVSAGNPECAIQNLRLALNEGYTNAKKIADDGSFARLRELPAFQQMIAAQGSPQ